MTSTEIVDDLIDELELIEKYDWQYIATVQEKCTALIQATYEEPLRLKTMLDQIYCNLMESVRGNLSAEERPVQDDETNSDNYSTASLEAMRLAIDKFWLKSDENKIPTQKAVSNYIAEQLSKPIRDRFTDELARAIKPENSN